MIYYSVLTALAEKPTLGVSPDNYDQKFLVDSQILGAEQSNQILQDLSSAAPIEMTALLESCRGDYTKTPSIINSLGQLTESTAVVLATDWVELTKRSGITVEISGTVLGFTSQSSFIVMNPSNLNRHTTIIVSHLGFPQIRPKIGDHIRAIGTVVIEKSQIILQSPFVELSDRRFSQINVAKLAAVKHRITVLKNLIWQQKS